MLLGRGGWSYLADDNPHRATPEGYQPNFVSPDQRFLGYTPNVDDSEGPEVILQDTTNDRQIRLRRSQPCTIQSFGMKSVVSAAFSALNVLVALGFSDGYIEIFRIDDEDNEGMVESLGHLNLPLANLVVADVSYPKPKRMAMKFNNAFDRLIVFHDIGDFAANQQGNGTFAVSEINVTDTQ
ncbi:hypothetical protein ABK905_20120 [Acerihabitans sp. KWT182]|uniref:Uncharacterized protein n=1 Tax=Acerihabitans sp. KWT182 TaxID=3157919 RepID=A0AAU7Q7A9_9GAMM